MTKNRALFGKESILFVDDDASIVLVQKMIFELYGYNVISFVSSHDALKEFKSRFEIFDIAIFDMAMPNMSGDKLSAELTKIRPDIPVLLCTGYSGTMSEEKAASIGIKGFLLKPIRMKDLAQKVSEILKL